MSTQTSKLALSKPAGNEANTRANYNALIDQIDATAMKDVFYCKSAVYNSGTSKIDVTIGSGTIVFLQTIVTKSTDSIYSISTPAINTSYYVYLSNAGVFTSNTTGVEVDGAIMVWKIIVGATFATITAFDLRSVVSGSAQAVKDLLDAHVGTGGSAHTNVIAAGVAGFMTGADKTKLDGVAVGATNYVHPSSHPPSIIVQDASNRFATDSEKAAWNAKADNSALTGHLADNVSHITAPERTTWNAGKATADTAKTTADTAKTTADAALPKNGGTMTGALTAQANANYTVAQVRNAILSTADPSGGNNGDVWIKYKP